MCHFFVVCTVWWKLYTDICEDQQQKEEGKEVTAEYLRSSIRLRLFFYEGLPNTGLRPYVLYSFGAWRFCCLAEAVFVFSSTVTTEFPFASNGWFREKREDEPDKTKQSMIIWSFAPMRVCTAHKQHLGTTQHLFFHAACFRWCQGQSVQEFKAARVLEKFLREHPEPISLPDYARCRATWDPWTLETKNHGQCVITVTSRQQRENNQPNTIEFMPDASTVHAHEQPTTDLELRIV